MQPLGPKNNRTGGQNHSFLGYRLLVLSPRKSKNQKPLDRIKNIIKPCNVRPSISCDHDKPRNPKNQKYICSSNQPNNVSFHLFIELVSLTQTFAHRFCQSISDFNQINNFSNSSSIRND